MNKYIAFMLVVVLGAISLPVSSVSAGDLLLNSVLTSSVSALNRSDLLFYLSFDKNINADYAVGSAIPVKTAALEFVEGYSGRGLLVGGKDSTISYSSDKNIQLEAGSVSMWIKPLEWDQDPHNRLFFTVNDAEMQGSFLWLYKYYMYSVMWLAWQENPTPMQYFAQPTTGDRGGILPFDWKADTWAHIIASWSGGQLSLYVNGQLVDYAYVPTRNVLQKFAETWQLGGANQKNGGTADTVIDEVIVMSRPVTPEEAMQICKQGIKAFSTNDANEKDLIRPYISINTGYEPSYDRASIAIDVIGPKPDEIGRFVIEHQISNIAGEKVSALNKVQLKQLKDKILIDASGLALGKYTILLNVYENNELVLSKTNSFEKIKKPEWVGNKLGYIDGNAPQPWTNPEIKDDSVECYGRRYSWQDHSILPTQITSKNRNLLSRPMSIIVKVGGKEVALSDQKIEFVKTTPSKVSFNGSAKINSIDVTIKGWLDFDGFLWCTINLLPSENSEVEVSDIALEIPLKQEIATLVQGLSPSIDGTIKNFKGVISPVIWLGNEEVGLQWYTDNQKYWHLTDKNNAISLDKKQNEVVLKITFIDKPVKVKDQLCYTLGLVATPCKPFPADFRQWELKLNGINGQPKWQFMWGQWNRQGDYSGHGPYGYNVVGESVKKDIEKELSATSAQGKLFWLYWHSAAIWKGDPVLKIFGSEWGFEYSASANPLTSWRTFFNAPSQRDYIIWRFWKTLQENPWLGQGVGGVYIDCAQACWNDYEGERLYEILNRRDMQKRFYLGLKKDWPKLLVCNHQSYCVHMSQLSFSDIHLTGEHLTGEIARDMNYFKILTLDGMRAEYIGKNYGIPVIFLPQLLRSVAGDPQKEAIVNGPQGKAFTEHLLGMLWVHDVIPYNAYVYPGPIVWAGKAKAEFGWDKDTAFSGYWENSSLVQSQTDNSLVVTSVFTRPHKVMFVVMNNSDKDEFVILKPDWNKLNLSRPDYLTDVYARQECLADKDKCAETADLKIKVEDHIKLLVKARNFRVVAADSEKK